MKEHKFTVPKKDTVIRTVILIIALINNALLIFGKNPLPIQNDTVVAVVSFLFTAGSALAAWWYNNSFTTPAMLADEWMKAIIEQQKKCEEKKCEE